jgi:hypothetical protein
MSKLLQPIPPQSYEKIRDRIADVLIDEIQAQLLMTSTFSDFFLDTGVKVFVERSVAIDHTSLPCLNICLSEGDYTGKNAKSADGSYVYNIDAYLKDGETDTEEGDTRSNVKLQRLLGVCRAVLENPVYRTLGFSAPMIAHTSCSKISIAEIKNQDVDYTAMGRLSFRAVASESNELIEAVLIAGYETKVKIAETEQGYYWIGEN